MKITKMFAVGAACVGLVFAGCTVDKTKEGNIPDVDVDVHKQGEVEMPNYDVKPADVDVGLTSKTITVPDVDVNMPPESAATPAPANSDQ